MSAAVPTARPPAISAPPSALFPARDGAGGTEGDYTGGSSPLASSCVSPREAAESFSVSYLTTSRSPGPPFVSTEVTLILRLSRLTPSPVADVPSPRKHRRRQRALFRPAPPGPSSCRRSVPGTTRFPAAARPGRGTTGWRLLTSLVTRDHLNDLLAHMSQVGAQADEDLGGDTLALAHEAEQHVLGADVVVTQLKRLTEGQLEDLLRTWRERRRPRRGGPRWPDRLLDFLDAQPRARCQGTRGPWPRPPRLRE